MKGLFTFRRKKNSIGIFELYLLLSRHLPSLGIVIKNKYYKLLIVCEENHPRNQANGKRDSTPQTGVFVIVLSW